MSRSVDVSPSVLRLGCRYGILAGTGCCDCSFALLRPALSIVGITQGPKTETIAAGEKTADGWNVEVGIPLKNSGWNIQPKDGLKIGFNMHYNDDDDGGDRDHKLIWSAEEVKLGEASWQNPSRFAELQFVAAFLSVDSAGKAATTWGGIKSFLR